ncbi:hypothetical protein [Runella rosea]|uniref:hypothetical protein n=1 Tax=Runella rosea TaxID=2259595 RepID=UPI0013B3EB10|nr:hypothetical protein [Runella rosea]
MDRQSVSRMERRRKYVVAAGECVIDPKTKKAQAEKRAAFISLLRADKPPIFTPEHPKNVLVQLESLSKYPDHIGRKWLQKCPRAYRL